MSEYTKTYGRDCDCIPIDMADFDPSTPIIGYRSKIINGGRFTIGEKYKTTFPVDQHFNWFQKLMWKLCFGVKVEDYSEE